MGGGRIILIRRGIQLWFYTAYITERIKLPISAFSAFHYTSFIRRKDYISEFPYILTTLYEFYMNVDMQVICCTVTSAPSWQEVRSDKIEICFGHSLTLRVDVKLAYTCSGSYIISRFYMNLKFPEGYSSLQWFLYAFQHIYKTLIKP